MIVFIWVSFQSVDNCNQMIKVYSGSGSVNIHSTMTPYADVVIMCTSVGFYFKMHVPSMK